MYSDNDDVDMDDAMRTIVWFGW